ncbi:MULTISPECIES: transporter substrate-binding domain-containing protein [unclassified Pseudomonas]|uniref:transporter substrate-binding domain-containing protein n=1 Tax=unclassified Pseudomonas TaxID=196821 RepID=UPI002AC9C75F|nr:MULTISPECIES: transporter substrate-binding domain-containing protein [unclassified Pseudomonas]MEB0042568.1 transporter substrate-binding domain-containing protein [Pseudomonas sp. MH10]MEB0077301.1 transporter substrate-binding domain-containing protein [Pseudomonas sp. MH10out]MEB0091368.1 transporter substrate-binding domain-containing protein [Pseudomonas sp. CCI4.2]MEB0104098.1 transporter substrate-binding domain-containing protein [Pseudomonas sp. CCI3.2]MEB0123940.1 transporter sub
MKALKLFSPLVAAFALVTLICAPVQAADDVIRVGTDATFPPMEFVKDDKRTGFDVELIEAIGKQLGKKVEWVDIGFKGLIPGLIANRFDVAASAIYMTEERRKVVNFTDSYYRGGLAVLVLKDDTSIKVPADLVAGKKVSAQVGTKSIEFLKTNYPAVEVVEVEKNQAMFDLLTIGRVNAAVTGRPAAVEFAKSQPKVRVLDQGLTTELYGFAVRKDEGELQKQMNQALQTLRSNGEYAALTQKWFGTTVE